ncbi:tRNA pseudouridine(55) synthase TruB [Serpentinicella sp. ANB-PHB4]|uniref:tRNA pseudouridine(55) synthase TruB n=1 Tax=Serpentinicella sp. ANB-PHB4 TaxID=3074076 RepID=UPI00286393F8|nr:tRNA pseudouridine(55) synthase TruB [Serpentinicella sp. ANB-PHB4]MDR5658217.1 tRNA pseudouridine(55) synthase TruB [Serpentinicella sp. ANB-PHB4]
MEGIINILKPPGMSSHDVVNIIRKKTNIKKVGHTGTLDPSAAGVLPICIGKATKISNYLLNDTKSYRAELLLGIETDTQDTDGQILKTKTINKSKEDIIRTILSFVGVYNQVPPMYSALKVGGKKLYDFAREGIEIERKSRRIEIYKIHIVYIKDNRVLFDVECSKGTYIRTLCHDIGQALECGGTMSFLLRTRAGKFDIDSTISIEELNQTNLIKKHLLPIDYPLTHIPKIHIHPSQKKLALNGNPISEKYFTTCGHCDQDQTVAIYLENKFVGLGKIQNDPSNNALLLKFSRLLI